MLKQIAITAVALAAVAGPALGQPVGYDVTRSWTECTRGSANSCAALTLQTYGLSTGGTHVAIGLSNLQGSSLYDNLAGSLLVNASFGMAHSAGGQSLGGSLSGANTGGASGRPTMDLSADGFDIALTGPGGTRGTNGSASVFNSHYTCFGKGGCTYSTYTTFASYRFLQTTAAGLAGANSSASYLNTSLSNTGAQAEVGSYFTQQSCGLLSCTIIYIANNYYANAGVNNEWTHSYSAMGSTPFGSSVWFQFDSNNQYDARDVSDASFGVYNTANGALLNCNSNNSSQCFVVSDVTTGGNITSTPEPASLGLLGTGLLGLGLVGWRRRRRTASDQ